MKKPTNRFVVGKIKDSLTFRRYSYRWKEKQLRDRYIEKQLNRQMDEWTNCLTDNPKWTVTYGVRSNDRSTTLQISTKIIQKLHSNLRIQFLFNKVAQVGLKSNSSKNKRDF